MIRSRGDIMVFNGYHDYKRDSGQLCGKQIDVACKSWTTSTGKITPLMIKYMEDGEIKTIDEIQIHANEEKFYCGRPTIEFLCSIIVDGVKNEVKLLFFPDSCRWSMRI